jgi:hypothetical protein
MLGGAKGRHWHLPIIFFRLYTYGNNFYESACQNLDMLVSPEACELSVLVQACTSTGKKIVKNTDA